MAGQIVVHCATVEIVQHSSIGEVIADIAAIREHALRDGAVIIRGAVSLERVAQLNERVDALFDPGADVRVSGEYRREMPDFQRLDLGEYGASTRFARYFFFFPWNSDPVLDEVSALQMEIMKAVAERDESYASSEDDNPDRYRISYVIQYPTGGGFMSKHREFHRQEAGDHAFVLTLALTTRGKDFARGGAYLYNDETKLDIEASSQAGDILIYRGDLFHGVDGVDPDQPLVLDRLCGRRILLTTTKYFGDSARLAEDRVR